MCLRIVNKKFKLYCLYNFFIKIVFYDFFLILFNYVFYFRFKIVLLFFYGLFIFIRGRYVD